MLLFFKKYLTTLLKLLKPSSLLSDSEVYYSAVDPNFQKKDHTGEDYRTVAINFEQLKIQISNNVICPAEAAQQLWVTNTCGIMWYHFVIFGLEQIKDSWSRFCDRMIRIRCWTKRQRKKHQGLGTWLYLPSTSWHLCSIWWQHTVYTLVITVGYCSMFWVGLGLAFYRTDGSQTKDQAVQCLNCFSSSIFLAVRALVEFR